MRLHTLISAALSLAHALMIKECSAKYQAANPQARWQERSATRPRRCLQANDR